MSIFLFFSERGPRESQLSSCLREPGCNLVSSANRDTEPGTMSSAHSTLATKRERSQLNLFTRGDDSDVTHVDLNRCVTGGRLGDDYHSDYQTASDWSSDCQTPASIQTPSSCKSPSPGTDPGAVFTFEPEVTCQQQQTMTSSVKSCSKTPVANGAEPARYMNLTFPGRKNRCVAPIVLSPTWRESFKPVADYANVTIDYAEIDLSKTTAQSNKVERNCKDSAAPALVNGGGTEYSVIDLVATAAATQAAKAHSLSREDTGRKHLRRRTGSSSSVTNACEAGKVLVTRSSSTSAKVRKERKGSSSSSCGSGSKSRYFLSRRTSSASREGRGSKS